jgi:hypothetical protein
MECVTDRGRIMSARLARASDAEEHRSDYYTDGDWNDGAQDLTRKK